MACNTEIDDLNIDLNATSFPNSSRNYGWNIYYGIVAGFTILNNLIILIVIFVNRTLHNSANFVMASMFFASIIFAVAYLIPRFVVPEMIQNSQIYCSLYSIIAPTAIVIINLHLMAISYDKYRAAHNPFFHHQTKHHKAAGVISIVIIWATAVYIGLLPIMAQIRPLNHTYCIPLNYDRLADERLYYYLTVVIFFILPFIFKTYFYVSVYNLVKKSPAHSETQKIRRHYKAAKVIATLVLVYFLMWVPFVVYILVLVSITRQQYLLNFCHLVRWREISQSIAFLFPALNPVLYAYYIPIVRNCVLRIHRHRVRSDSLARITYSTNGLSTPANIGNCNENINSPDPKQNDLPQQKAPTSTTNHHTDNSTFSRSKSVSNTIGHADIINDGAHQTIHDEPNGQEQNPESYSTGMNANVTDSSLESDIVTEEIDDQQYLTIF